MTLINNISGMHFKEWIWRSKENKLPLIIFSVMIVVQFTVFKLLYPYPNFMWPDSFSYIEAAMNNANISFWPVGYSHFIRFISSFFSTAFALVLIQYATMEAALLYLLFSIRYLFKLNKTIFYWMSAGLLLNPLLLHICNFVSSDAVFISLSVIWFTQLLWLLYKPSPSLMLWHAFVLFLIFTFRYVGIYYPVISIVLIFFINCKIYTKVITILSIAILLGSFVAITQSEYLKETGKSQFSPFGGWQLAANALYGYARVEYTDPVSTVPDKFKSLHAIVNHQVDSLRQTSIRPDSTVGVYYLWDLNSPLKQYVRSATTRDIGQFERWASVAPLYAAYGRYLTFKHPGLFLKHFVYPNFWRYYFPTLASLETYNIGKDTVNRIAATWFGWSTNKLFHRSGNNYIVVSSYYSTFISLVNLTFLISCCIAFAFRLFPNTYTKNAWILAGSFWFLNLLFSVVSAPTELRYQAFPGIISYVFLLLSLTIIKTKFNVNIENIFKSS